MIVTFTFFSNIFMCARILHNFLNLWYQNSLNFLVYFILNNIKIVYNLYFTGIFPMLRCCRDYKNLTNDKKFLQSRFFVSFSGSVSSFLKYKRFFKLVTRKFYFPKYKTFFHFSSSESYFLKYKGPSINDISS